MAEAPGPQPDWTIDELLYYVAQLFYYLVGQIQTFVANIANTLANYFSNLVYTLITYLSTLLANLTAWISNTVSTILAYIGEIMAGVADNISAIFNYVGDILASVFATLGAQIGQMVTAINNALTNILNQLSNVIQQIWDAMANAIAGLIDSVSAWINDAVAQIQALIGTVVDTIVSWIQEAIGLIGDFIAQAIEYVQNLVQTASDAVTTVINFIIDLVLAALNQVSAVITAAWEQLVTGAETIIDSINERIGGLRDAFMDAATELVTSLSGISGEALEPMRDALKSVADNFISWIDPPTIAALQQANNQLASPTTFAVHDRAQAYQVFQNIQPQSPMQRFLWHLIWSVGTALKLYGGIADANAQIILQEHAAVYPYNILSPADVVVALQRGAIAQAEAVEIIKRHGFSVGNAQRLIDNGTTAPAPQDLVAMWLRGILDEGGLSAALKRHGLTEDWVSRIKTHAFFIPPAQDLITMAVREVFSPEVVARFGQMEGFPQIFASHARKQGLSEEWARNYWAAHWSLPSATQGFEMLHRGVIGPDDLDLLLKSLDVMPFWREKLVEIAYSTYTRVDIRRMHQLGILTEADVHKAHLELGYNEEKATNLTQFVLKLNRHAPAEDDEELGRLSRSSVLGFYQDGLLDSSRAVQLLMSLGYTIEGARLYVQAVDLDTERRDRQTQVDTVLDLYRAGELTFEQASDKLADLGLEDAEIQRAFAKLARSRAQDIKLPDLDTGTKLFQAGIINKVDFKALLLALGFPERWAVNLIKLAEAQNNATAH